MEIYITIVVGLSEEDSDVESLAKSIVADIQDKYKYLDIDLVEVE